MTLRHRAFATLAYRSAFEFLFEVASLNLSNAILDESSKKTRSSILQFMCEIVIHMRFDEEKVKPTNAP